MSPLDPPPRHGAQRRTGNFRQPLAPASKGLTDSPLPMHSSAPRDPKQASVPPPGPLADASVEERMARWDELPPWDLEVLTSNSATNSKLARVKDAEAELTGGLDSLESCPPPEDLFDLAGGPGGQILTPHRTLEIRAHMELCSSCTEIVGSLERTPPPPFLLGEEAPQAPKRPLRLVARNVGRWIPMAAAALALLGIVWQLGGGPVSAAWPQQPVLRGAAEADLLFPRGPVLTAANGLDWAASPRFEVTPVEGADLYRLRVRVTDGSAFVEGEPVLELTSTEPIFLATTEFAAGYYTWETWVTEGGLERPLGERDFRVVANADLRLELHAAFGLRRVQLLHDAGYVTDARRAARGLPASQERDAYLGRAPLR
jgi:hypothetical protein